MDDPKFNKALVPLERHKKRADEMAEYFGITNRYSAGCPSLDQYLGGGYGRKGDGYEIVLLYGSTGCIDGDSRIHAIMVDSGSARKRRISQLYKNQEGIREGGGCHKFRGSPIMVKGFNLAKNRVEWAPARVIKTGEKECLCITTENGRSAILSLDHKMYVEGVGYVEARSLREGDILIDGQTHWAGNGKKRQQEVAEHTVKYHPREDRRKVVNGYTYYRIKKHHLSYEADLNGISTLEYRNLLNSYDGRELQYIPRGMEIDHIDGDNNDPSNLQMLSKADHARKTLRTASGVFGRLVNDRVRITSITPAGLRQTYDIQMHSPNHNYFVNDLLGHNSGKSIFGLNMMLDPIMKGERVGLMVLEDDPADVVNRLRVMTNGAIDDASNVFFAEDQSQGYTLDQALQAVEEWFKVCDVIFLDHLEYLFAGALGESERDVFMKQAIWMRRLNSLMKGNGKTIVMVQHTNKTQEQGLNKIKGSGAFAQTCTKIIEVNKIPGGTTVKLWKSRFTITRDEWLELSLSNFRIGDA